MAKQDSDFGSFLFGFLMGGVVGAAVGLLFAPAAGTDTREQIKQKSVELSDVAAKRADEYRAKAEEILADARTKGEQMMTDTRSKVEEAVADLQKRAKELQKQTEELADGEEAKIEAAVGEALEEATVVADDAKDEV